MNTNNGATMETQTAWNGNTAGGAIPREKDDAYYTPDALALAICRKLKSVGVVPSLVIEPSAGQGAFLKGAMVWSGIGLYAFEPGDVFDGDLKALSETVGFGALKAPWESDEARARAQLLLNGTDGPALIVGNPPFKFAEEHVSIALKRMRPGDNLCFLLRASFLAGGGRFRELHRGGCLKYVWNVVGRPSFVRGATDTAEYAVLCWEKGHTGGYRGDWLEWK